MVLIRPYLSLLTNDPALFRHSPDPAYEFNKRLRRVYESTFPLS